MPLSRIGTHKITRRSRGPEKKVTKSKSIAALSAIILGLGAHATSSRALESQLILVLSVASASTALEEIATEYMQRSGNRVRVSIGSSGTLARQIMQGAPADIYLSAAVSWIDNLQREGLLDPNHIGPIARNRLVFVSPTDTPDFGLLDLSKPLDVMKRLDGGRLAMGDPAHVPAGRYAQEALEKLGLWPAVRDHLALHVNVRAVLAMVERGETPLGVIYATDAVLSRNVSLAAIVPGEAHLPINYIAAVIADRGSPGTIEFFDTLFSLLLRTYSSVTDLVSQHPGP